MRLSDNGEIDPGEQGSASEAAEFMDARLEDIIECIPAGLLMCDSGDRVVACNTLFRQMFVPGLQACKAGDMNYADLLRLVASGNAYAGTETDSKWMHAQLERHRNPGKPFRQELGNGRILHSFHRRIGDGGTLSVHTDITDLKEQHTTEVSKTEQLNVVLESMDQGISMMDADLNLVTFNECFLELLEFPSEFGKRGMHFTDFIRYNAERGEYGDGDIETLVQERVDLALKFQPHRFERTRPDGTVIEIVGKPVASGGFVTTYTDITERKNAEQTLLKRDQAITEQNRRFNAALDNMSQGLVMFDKDRRLLVCNKRYVEVYNLPENMAKPGTLYDDIVQLLIERGDYLGVVDPESYLADRMAMVTGNQSVTKIQELNGGRSICMVHRPMPGGGWVATHEDVTALQKVHAQVAHMAHHDDLTGLPNRTLLRARLEEAVSGLEGDKGFAVLCLDLDRFKNVNDTIGHPMGDKLLMAAADRLCNCVRAGDTIARLGGDEFAILQMSGDQPSAAEALAARICDVFTQPYDLDGHQTVIGASIGIALAPSNGKRPDQLMKNADMALYSAKNDGRGVYRFFRHQMGTEVRTRRALETELRAAFEQGEFELHYQPLVDLESESVTGFEALLRWMHPRRGNVSPADFIPVAEEIGLIAPMGRWIINQACQDAARWPITTRVAVNLSPAQFRDDNLVQTVFSALAKSKLRPQQLELEITEQVLLQESNRTLTVLHTLRDMGVRIAMDDFGTGYSSLSYLRSFPFDKIKIDRSFVADLCDRPESAVIVNAVASLSRNLGMTATAEGVETESQREHVRAAGYTEMQGFLVSPALPAAEVEEKFLGGTDAAQKRMRPIVKL